MYVISAKKEKYNSNEFEWKYFQYDNGAFGSGYPIFSDFWGAKIYYTIEDARKEFEKARRCMDDNILPKTLGIREIKFKFVEVCKL